MGHDSPRRGPVSRFRKRLSGLFVPKFSEEEQRREQARVQKMLHESQRRFEESQAPRPGRRRLNVHPTTRNLRKADNRRKNKAARKARRKNRV